MLLYSTRPFVWIQVLAAAFLCTPRLFSGGHWLSDIIVGGGSVSLVALSIYTGTNIYNNLNDWLTCKILRKKEITSQI